MKSKGNIFNWFRRKRIAVIGNNQKENISNNKEKNDKKKEIKPNITITKPKNIEKYKSNPSTHSTPPKEEIVPTPKEVERETLIKPTRPILIEEVPSIKEDEVKDEAKNEEDPKDKIKKAAPIEEEKKEHNEEIKEEILIEPNINFPSDNFIYSPIPSNDIIIKNDTLDEIEKMLIKNYQEIKNIKYEIEVLEQEEKDEEELKEIEQLIEQLNYLIKKFEQIKKDFYNVNYQEIYLHSTNDNYISHLIQEYKTAIQENTLNNTSILKVKQIEEYIELINDIIEIENTKDTLNDSLEQKKASIITREEEFEELKEQSVDLEKINDYIDNFTKNQEYIIKDIEAKIKNSTTITKNAEYKTELAINYTKMLTSTLLLASTNIIPPTKAGNLLKISLMCFAIAGFAQAITNNTKEKKVTTKISYIDYKDEIKSSINDINDISHNINKAMTDIKDLKKTFEKEFSEYKHVIPEYVDMITKLDTIEKNLVVNYNIAKEYDKKLNEALNKNNVKVKKIEEDYY